MTGPATGEAAAPVAGTTLGVSVRVPEPWATMLQEARAGFGDPAAWTVFPHVTLLGPTPVPEADRAAVTRHLDRVAAAAAPFVLRLRGTGSFRPVSPVAFVDVVEGGERCAELEAAVRSGPLAQEPRFPYHPHVTVAHHVPDERLDAAVAELAGLDATFLVTAFESFRQVPDGSWRTVRVHALRGRSPGTRPVLPVEQTGEIVGLVRQPRATTRTTGRPGTRPPGPPGRTPR